MNSETKKQPSIVAIGTANPSFQIDQKQAEQLMTSHYADELRPRSLEVLHKVLSHPSVARRCISVDNVMELLSVKNEDPDKRIERFRTWAVKLCGAAIQKALADAGLKFKDIDTLIVNTCTGYLCPGIATYLIEELGLDKSTHVYDLVGSGCAGAIPNLQLAAQMIDSKPDSIVVAVSVEICSATFEMDNDIALIISNAIFGDGAAAVVIRNSESGAVLLDSATYFEPKYRSDVQFVYKKGRLHNRLSPQLPSIIGDIVPPIVENLLHKHGLKYNDIAHWAIHPGGDKMLNVLQEKFGLSDSQMSINRAVLKDYGNMSSPTVLFELKSILENGVKPGDKVIALAFGAGLSVHAYLLKVN